MVRADVIVSSGSLAETRLSQEVAASPADEENAVTTTSAASQAWAAFLIMTIPPSK